MRLRAPRDPGVTSLQAPRGTRNDGNLRRAFQWRDGWTTVVASPLRCMHRRAANRARGMRGRRHLPRRVPRREAGVRRAARRTGMRGALRRDRARHFRQSRNANPTYLTPESSKFWRARQESNLYQELRKLSFYPLNYGHREAVLYLLLRVVPARLARRHRGMPAHTGFAPDMTLYNPAFAFQVGPGFPAAAWNLHEGARSRSAVWAPLVVLLSNLVVASLLPPQGAPVPD